MSVQAMTAVLDGPPTTSTERLVLLIVANRANEDGECWPSVERLVRDTCLSPRAVKATLRALADKGLIARESRGRGKTGGLKSAMTRLTIQGAPAAPRIETRVQETSIQGAPDAPRIVIDQGAGGAPKPTLEQSEEPTSQARATFERVLKAWKARDPGKATRKLAWTAWQAARIEPERLALAALRYLAEDDTARRLGVKALHLWLAEERWEAWLNDAAVTAPAWRGPAQIRQALSEDFARSYLDPSTWDEHRGAIVTRTGVAATALKRVLPMGSGLGVMIIERGEAT